MKLYLDACALNRLLDDQRQPRIRREAEAVEDIFRLIQARKVQWVAGTALESEIMRNPDFRKRKDALWLLKLADEQPTFSAQTLVRATILEKAGYGAFDALHLAMAEEAVVDVLITTDDRFLKQATRGLGNPGIPVLNPLNWMHGRKP